MRKANKTLQDSCNEEDDNLRQRIEKMNRRVIELEERRPGVVNVTNVE